MYNAVQYILITGDVHNDSEVTPVAEHTVFIGKLTFTGRLDTVRRRKLKYRNIFITVTTQHVFKEHRKNAANVKTH